MSANERVLIHRAKQGDTGAFEQLVNQHSQFVYNLALRLLNDPQEAEDLTQEAFIRAWKALPRFREDARFTTWLYRIVTNLCYNRMPRLKTEFEAADPDEDVELPSGGPSIESSIMNAETKQYLHQAISALPENYKLLITLRHLQGLSYQEIADSTGLPLGTVKTGIFRARRQLKEVLVPLLDGQINLPHSE